jgi:hydrogenase nickel incorporation protein HypA/HybF
VRIGRFSGVQPEALRFAWQVLRAGTISAEAELEIEEIPIRLRCRSCGSEFAADPDDLSCPLCESLDQEMLSGRELELQSIKGEKPDEDGSEEDKDPRYGDGGDSPARGE